MRLDSIGTYPTGMEEYLSYYGWHFSKKMCEFAISNMRDKNNSVIIPIEKERLDELLEKHNIKLEHNKGYDYIYVANMCKSDFLGSSINGETELLKFLKDYIDDADAYDGMPFTRYYADCIGSGTPIIWSDMI